MWVWWDTDFKSCRINQIYKKKHFSTKLTSLDSSGIYFQAPCGWDWNLPIDGLCDVLVVSLIIRNTLRSFLLLYWALNRGCKGIFLFFRAWVVGTVCPLPSWGGALRPRPSLPWRRSRPLAGSAMERDLTLSSGQSPHYFTCHSIVWWTLFFLMTEKQNTSTQLTKPFTALYFILLVSGHWWRAIVFGHYSILLLVHKVALSPSKKPIIVFFIMCRIFTKLLCVYLHIA